MKPTDALPPKPATPRSSDRPPGAETNREPGKLDNAGQAAPPSSAQGATSSVVKKEVVSRCTTTTVVNTEEETITKCRVGPPASAFPPGTCDVHLQ